MSQLVRQVIRTRTVVRVQKSHVLVRNTSLTILGENLLIEHEAGSNMKHESSSPKIYS